jgi:hypothetical protein
MKKASLTVLISLSMLAGAAYAQSNDGVTMSTDPAKAAEVEQRAQSLQSQQDQMPMHEMPMHKKTPHHKHMHKPMHKHAAKGKAASAAEPASSASE